MMQHLRHYGVVDVRSGCFVSFHRRFTRVRLAVRPAPGSGPDGRHRDQRSSGVMRSSSQANLGAAPAAPSWPRLSISIPTPWPRFHRTASRSSSTLPLTAASRPRANRRLRASPGRSPTTQDRRTNSTVCVGPRRPARWRRRCCRCVPSAAAWPNRRWFRRRRLPGARDAASGRSALRRPPQPRPGATMISAGYSPMRRSGSPSSIVRGALPPQTTPSAISSGWRSAI